MTARVMSALILAVALSVAAFVFLNRAGPVEIPFTDDRSVAEGRVVYETHCAVCHGAGLDGEANWEDRDTEGYLPAPPLDDTGHAWHHADVLLVGIVSDGPEVVVGGGYKSRMPGFADRLSNDDILAVLAYMKSTWPLVIVEAHNWVNGKPSAAPVSLEELAACGLSLGIADATSGED
jgi:mono/diheme cytochrome c family protein